MSSEPKHGPGRAGSDAAVIATAFAAVGVIATVMLSSQSAEATERAPSEISAPYSRPVEPAARGSARNPGLPRLEPRRLLGPADEVAALEAVQIALTEVGDGASYVWHRHHGRLSGVVKPTASFRDGRGRICRHVHVVLTSGDYARRAEGIACRDDDGVWSLDG